MNGDSEIRSNAMHERRTHRLCDPFAAVDHTHAPLTMTKGKMTNGVLSKVPALHHRLVLQLQCDPPATHTIPPILLLTHGHGQV